MGFGFTSFIFPCFDFVCFSLGPQDFVLHASEHIVSMDLYSRPAEAWGPGFGRRFVHSNYVVVLTWVCPRCPSWLVIALEICWPSVALPEY